MISCPPSLALPLPHISISISIDVFSFLSIIILPCFFSCTSALSVPEHQSSYTPRSYPLFGKS